MFRVGQQIGIYTLIREIGRGGFGEVWLAEKTSEGFRTFTKRVAVKLPHRDQIDFKEIEQEALLWEEASGHPNVLPIIDADIYDGQIVIVSEYADGGSIAEKLERDGKFTVRKAVETAVGILSGLEYLHQKRIIHRDIKPHNILLQGEMPRLADFGISRAMQTTTVSSSIVGTDAYMSPEALDGKRNVQTDLWSVGVVLYELLKDDLPFPQIHPSERMFAILTKEYEPLSLEIPVKLRDIVKKSLAKNPAERYFSATEMKRDLFALLSELTHQNFAETQSYSKESVGAKHLFETNEQLPDTLKNENLRETVQPIRLKELEETDYHIQQTEPTPIQRITGENDSRQNIKTIESLNFGLPQNVRQTKTDKSFLLKIGAVIVGALLLFGTIFGGYFMLFPKNDVAVSNSTLTNLTDDSPSSRNKVLNGDKIRIGRDLNAFVGSNNKLTVDLKINGIGSAEVIEEIRKDDNLQIEINGKMATITDSMIVNGAILQVRADTQLTAEESKTFKENKQQDFVLSITMFYNDDAIAKRIETKYRKGKGQSSLGDLVVFSDTEEQNIKPIKTKPPVVIKTTPTPLKEKNLRENNYPKTTVTENNMKTDQVKPKSTKGTAINDSVNESIVNTQQKTVKKVGKAID